MLCIPNPQHSLKQFHHINLIMPKITNSRTIIYNTKTNAGYHKLSGHRRILGEFEVVPSDCTQTYSITGHNYVVNILSLSQNIMFIYNKLQKVYFSLQ